MISVHYFPKRDHIYCVANRKFIIILGPGCQTGAKLQLEDGLSLPKQCFFYHRERDIFKTVFKEPCRLHQGHEESISIKKTFLHILRFRFFFQ